MESALQHNIDTVTHRTALRYLIRSFELLGEPGTASGDIQEIAGTASTSVLAQGSCHLV